MTKPTQRTLKQLKEWGFLSHVAERWNPWAKVRQDAFGCIDIIAVREGVGVLFIQTTSGSCHSARRKKIEASEQAKTLLDAGCKIELWSWAPRGARGKRKVMTLRREEIKNPDLQTSREGGDADRGG